MLSKLHEWIADMIVGNSFPKYRFANCWSIKVKIEWEYIYVTVKQNMKFDSLKKNRIVKQNLKFEYGVICICSHDVANLEKSQAKSQKMFNNNTTCWMIYTKI